MFLYAPIERFICSMLRPGGGRRDLINRARVTVTRYNLEQEFEKCRLAKLSLGEIAAMVWLTEIRSVLTAAQDGAAIRFVNFEEFITAPHEGTLSIADTLGVPFSGDDRANLEKSQVFKRNSKHPLGGTFSRVDRDEIHNQMKQHFADEIQKGVDWLTKRVEWEQSLFDKYSIKVFE